MGSQRVLINLKFNQFLKLDITEFTKFYPKDHKDQNGFPFWNHVRQFPKTIEYDPNNELHATFIRAAALWAHVQGIACVDVSDAPAKAARVPVPEASTTDGDDETVTGEEIAKWKELGRKMCPVHFEKTMTFRLTLYGR